MAVKKVKKPTTANKAEVKLAFQRHEKDTGSPEVQSVLLSDEITTLQSHLESHKKDYDAKRSLLKKVAKRRTLLKYLKGKDVEAYTTVSKKLGLKV